MRDFMIRNRASIWLCFMVMIVASTMMTPHFGSLLAIGIIAILVFTLRTIAHIEGHASADRPASKREKHDA